jgi:hypothetical protein
MNIKEQNEQTSNNDLNSFLDKTAGLFAVVTGVGTMFFLKNLIAD